MENDYRTDMFNRTATIGAGHFKSTCLQLLDDVKRTRKPLTITKHGKAIAQLVPMPPEVELFGAMRGDVLFEEDIVSPIDVPWSATT